MNLPKLSIAAKLYAIFTLMATATIARSGVAVQSAQQHAALTGDFESANAGSQNIEHANGLIDAMMMETRGIYLAQDREMAARHADALLKVNAQLDMATSQWRATVQNSDAADFSRFTVRISDFRKFAPELARIAEDSEPQTAIFSGSLRAFAARAAVLAAACLAGGYCVGPSLPSQSFAVSASASAR